VDDGFQVEQGRLEQGIDDDVVEVPGLCDLVAGVDHALRDDFGCVLAAAAQAAVQLFPRRRQDEDQHGAREDALDLQRALEVDLQHDIVAIAQALLHRGARGAVVVAMNLGPLEEIAVVDHLAEGIGGDEPVLAAVLFLAAGRAGGVGDRHHQAGVDLQQGLDEAGLAGAGRGGDDVEVAGVVGGNVGLGHVGLAKCACAFRSRCTTAPIIHQTNLVMHHPLREKSMSTSHLCHRKFKPIRYQLGQKANNYLLHRPTAVHRTLAPATKVLHHV
jgi:hypothetical protein